MLTARDRVPIRRCSIAAGRSSSPPRWRASHSLRGRFATSIAYNDARMSLPICSVA